MNFFEFAENLKNYPITKFLDDLSKSFDQDAFKSLIENQWDKGEDGNEQLFPVYSIATQNFYALINPPIKPKVAGSPYNLMWSGDLFNQTALTVENQNIDLLFDVDSQGIAKNSLFGLLEKAMNNPFDIFKLTPDNADLFTQIAQDSAIEILNNNLKLT